MTQNSPQIIKLLWTGRHTSKTTNTDTSGQSQAMPRTMNSIIRYLSSKDTFVTKHGDSINHPTNRTAPPLLLPKYPNRTARRSLPRPPNSRPAGFLEPKDRPRPAASVLRRQPARQSTAWEPSAHIPRPVRTAKTKLPRPGDHPPASSSPAGEARPGFGPFYGLPSFFGLGRSDLADESNRDHCQPPHVDHVRDGARAS